MVKKCALSASGGGGNANPPKSNRQPQVKMWIFRVSNYTEQDCENLKIRLEHDQFIFGKEICPTTGTIHLQGFVILKTKKSFSATIKYLGIKGIHVEPKCKDSTIDDNLRYCSKEGNYFTNFKKIPRKIEEISIISILHPWQQQVVDMISIPAKDREVVWIYDKVGDVGKSAMSKFLAYHHDAVPCLGGKSSDLYNIIFMMKVLDSKSIIIIDLPRACGYDVNYPVIESIKTGLICNTKYETGMRIFNSPHVIIFSNYEPEYGQLSIDKWRVYKINADLTMTLSPRVY